MIHGKYKKWSQEEDTFLIENYKSKGPKYCENKLDRTIDAIITRATGLGVNFEPVDSIKFKNINTPEVAYILGILWADGNLYKNEIKIECVSDDLDGLKHIFLTTGTWREFRRKRKEFRETMILSTGNKKLSSILTEYGYRNKSYDSADKVLNQIPKNLQHLFFRGLIDGDGNFYYNKKSYLRQFTLASTLEQDWSYLENLCKELGIKKYTIKKTKKNNSSSAFRITNKSDITKLGNFIYNNFENDKIGLIRKYDIFNIIKDS